MVGYFIRDRAEQRARCSRSSTKYERVVLAAASCVPLENRLIWTCCFLPGLTRHTATLYINPGLVLVSLKGG